MNRGVHGEKLVAALNSDKLPNEDIPMLENAIKKYDEWIISLNNVEGDSMEEIITKMVSLLNEYKFFIDVNLIFDSKQDFLYRQKGQLKLDNTITEEFMSILAQKCLSNEEGISDIIIDSQTPTFSSIYFTSSLSVPGVGGNMNVKTKDQDFSLSRALYLKASYSPNFEDNITIREKTYLGYVLAELKTNLDKTMFQEASATSHDVKQAVTGAKYYLLCDWLDMTPISTSTTDIDEILIMRKAKRISSNDRKKFSTYKGRQSKRDFYVNYLKDNPYSPQIFIRFMNHILSQLKDEKIEEVNVLENGYF